MATLDLFFHSDSQMESRVLLNGRCKARSTLLFGWPDEVSALLNRVVGWDAAERSQRRHRRETPDISERLRDTGGGDSRSAGALEAELLDAGFEGGGLRKSLIP